MESNIEKEKKEMVEKPEEDKNQTSDEKPERQIEKEKLKETENEEVSKIKETTAKEKDEKVVEDNNEVKEEIPAEETDKADFIEEKVDPEIVRLTKKLQKKLNLWLTRKLLKRNQKDQRLMKILQLRILIGKALW